MLLLTKVLFTRRRLLRSILMLIFKIRIHKKNIYGRHAIGFRSYKRRSAIILFKLNYPFCRRFLRGSVVRFRCVTGQPTANLLPNISNGSRSDCFRCDFSPRFIRNIQFVRYIFLSETLFGTFGEFDYRESNVRESVIHVIT